MINLKQCVYVWMDITESIYRYIKYYFIINVNRNIYDAEPKIIPHKLNKYENFCSLKLFAKRKENFDKIYIE